MAEKRDCPLCGEPLEDPPIVHDLAKCEKTELLKGREKIKKLTTSLYDWKYGEGGWFHLRDIIGRLSWEHHNCPHEVQPTPDPVPNRWLHPDDTYVREGRLVYQKTPSDWKLIGAGTSPEAGEAIIRLMQLENPNEGHPGNAEGSVRGREVGGSSPDPGIGRSTPSPDGNAIVGGTQEVR